MSKTNNMIKGENFCFGKGFIYKNKDFCWNPDDKTTQNAHLMITGASGSGKTRLLKKIIEYLRIKEKQVYVIDFHGDIETEYETKYDFYLRNSDYGLNPFDFHKDPHNGGPKAHVKLITEIFRKNIIPNMGAIQKSTIKRLFEDCYRYVGILDEDEKTWDNPIPTVNILYDFFTRVKEKIESNENFFLQLLVFARRTQTLKKQQNKLLSRLQEITEKEATEKKKEITEKEKKKMTEDELKKIEEEKRKKIEEIKKERGKIEKKLDKIYSEMEEQIGELKSKCDSYGNYILHDEELPKENSDEFKNINLDFYMNENIYKSLLSLTPYIEELKENSIFNDNKPPSVKGVVRYDISSLSNSAKPLEAMFFSDIMIQFIFRAYKSRGEYRYIAKKIPKKKDTMVDTFIVIDESKLILPSGKDKESPYNILNRIVSESRKYGVGLIIVSQRVGHFPKEMISSIYTKVILKTNENDIPDIQNLLGARQRDIIEHLGEEGVCLVGNIGGLFNSVTLPWFKGVKNVF